LEQMMNITHLKS